MNKLLKTALMTVVFVANVFAEENTVFELPDGGEIEQGAEVKLNGKTGVVQNGSELTILGRMTGSGKIKCEDSSTVRVLKSRFIKAADEDASSIKKACDQPDDDIQDVYVLDRVVGGGYLDSNIMVEPASQLKIVDGANNILDFIPEESPEKCLIYIAIPTDDPVAGYSRLTCAGGNDDSLNVPIALANADASIEGYAPSSLFMHGKLSISGNNKGFTEGTVVIGGAEPALPGEVVYETADSIFQVPTTIAAGKLTFPEEEITLTKNITVEKTETTHGCILFREKVEIPNGVTLNL